MSKKIGDKPISTIWLDFISYIFFPFYILTLSLEVLNSFRDSKIKFILLMICLLYIIFVFLNNLKRNKLAYYTMYSFYMISLITIVIYFSNKFNITKILYILEFLGVGFLLWVVPNSIYLYKRKKIFRKHNLANIKKCPGCNRIIPINMESCGKCNYKE